MKGAVGSHKGDEGGLSYASAASGHGGFGNHLSSRVAHPRPESPAEGSAPPRPRHGHGRAKGSAQAHARDGAGRGGEPARADEVDAKIVRIRQGGGARYILVNGRERQAGEEVGVSVLLSSSI